MHLVIHNQTSFVLYEQVMILLIFSFQSDPGVTHLPQYRWVGERKWHDYEDVSAFPYLREDSPDMPDSPQSDSPDKPEPSCQKDSHTLGSRGHNTRPPGALERLTLRIFIFD